MDENLRGRAGAGREEGWLTPWRFGLLLALLVLASFPSVMVGARTFINRDFGLFSYPVAFFHRESFWRGEIPLWNPFSFCGTPFLAQWNAMVLYPPSVVYLVLPLTWALPFFCLLHVFWGGLGMYHLAERWTGHRLGAGVGGVIFAFNGLTMNFLMWPSHIATFSWVPWMLWLVPEGWRQGGRRLVWGVVAGSLQMLAGGPETILLTWLILGVLAAGDWLGATGRRVPGRVLTMVLLVGLIAAAQLVPFLQLLAGSLRGSATAAAGYEWSLPMLGWGCFLVPLFHAVPGPQGVHFQPWQQWTSSCYAGIGTVWLSVVALVLCRVRRVWVMGGLGLVGLLAAMGDGNPAWRGLHELMPFLGAVRYPVKFVMLVLVAAPLLAAYGLRELARGERRWGRVEMVLGAGILLVIGLLAVMDWRDPVSATFQSASLWSAARGAGLLVLVCVVVGVLMRAEGKKRVVLGCVVIGVVWFDLHTHMPTQNPTVRPWVYAGGWVRAQQGWGQAVGLGQARVMLSPQTEEIMRLHLLPDLEKNYLVNRSASFANCNLLDDIPQVYGFFSLGPGAIDNLVSTPYVYTNLDCSTLMDFAGVSQVMGPGTLLQWRARPTAMPWITAGQKPVFEIDGRVMEAVWRTNTNLREVVFLPPEAQGEVGAVAQPQARISGCEFGRQSVVFQSEAAGPHLAVISQSWYPAWKASVDGKPAKLWRANYAFQAVEVPAGRHQVRLIYRDVGFWSGLMLSCLGIGCAIWIWIGSRGGRVSRACPVRQGEVLL